MDQRSEAIRKRESLNFHLQLETRFCLKAFSARSITESNLLKTFVERFVDKLRQR